MTGSFFLDIRPDKEVSLYFHIPFCTRKCDYCHFYVLPDEEAAKNRLADGIKKEWDLLTPLLKNKKVVTIYFGGGTPSLFGPERTACILNLVKSSCEVIPDVEITLEANPENITLELMQAYAKAGINRVSIGVQTLDPNLLKLLGRLHDPEAALKAVHQTHRAGIENISIDLMYDLPKQTLDHWVTTLTRLKEIPITHLSLYNLTIEPHTLFFKKEKELRPLLPSGEESLSMYEIAISQLESLGLRRYEISAFSRPGFESRHNTGYWTGRSFLGLGPSAFSYWDGRRFRNIAHLGKYCKALDEGVLPRDFDEQLDPDASRRELFVIRLRLREGVDMPAFISERGKLDSEAIQAVENLIKEGYLEWKNERLMLTHQGVLFYDTVASELI